MASALERALSLATRERRALEVHVDRASREAHAGDESGLAPQLPGAVVVPRDARDVVAILDAASEARVSVTPRGAATGKAGGAIPDPDGVALVLTELDAELDVDPRDRVAVVGAGVVLERLREAAQREGLFYGPDPSSLTAATIGGNVATNASGPSSLKYGSTARWVRGLDVVTGAGRLLSMPSRVQKSSVGLDLPALFVGSEGALGVITRVFVRLEPSPPALALALVSLPTLDAIGEALVALDRAHLAPRAVELLDDAALDALRQSQRGGRLDPRATALLFIELEGDPRALELELERLDDALAGIASDVRLARDEGEREAIWQVRRDASVALRASATHKLSEDVVVPRGRLADLVRASRRIGGEHGVRVASYGHAGQGNLHVNLLWDHDEQRVAVDRAMEALFREAVLLGGTLSGEHGIGRAKARYLELVHDPVRRAAARELKRLFDPAGILNPKKTIG